MVGRKKKLSINCNPFFDPGVGPSEISFCPETVLFRHGGVNLQACLCGVDIYASAQPLDFLATTKNPSFPIQKRRCSYLVFPNGH
jgi:hypothetical protein